MLSCLMFFDLAILFEKNTRGEKNWAEKKLVADKRSSMDCIIVSLASSWESAMVQETQLSHSFNLGVLT